MADEDNVPVKGNLLDQAKAAVNKQAKDAVVTKLKANFSKLREHEVAIATHEESMAQLNIENQKIMSEYERGLV